MIYIYQADLLCESCGRSLAERLRYQWADTGDSDDFPQAGIIGEADSPDHCASVAQCLEAVAVALLPAHDRTVELPLGTALRALDPRAPRQFFARREREEPAERRLTAEPAAEGSPREDQRRIE